jgi:hypothetical protein
MEKRKMKQIVVAIIAIPVALVTYALMAAGLHLSTTWSCVITLVVLGLLGMGLTRFGLMG